MISKPGRNPTEAALAGTVLRFDGIIASAMDAIITVDADQHIVLFNPAAEKMFGLAAQDALGTELSRFIPERYRQAHAQQVETFGRTGQSTRHMGGAGAISGLRASGEEFPIEASISQVDTPEGKLFTVILRDVTARRRTEERLRQAQAELEKHAERLEQVVSQRTAELQESVAELEAFSYSLSHDLRAPLRAIHTFTDIVLEDHGSSLVPEVKELLGKVTTAAQRMDTMLQEVLMFSRVSRQPIELGPVDTEALVREVVANRSDAPEAGVHIHIQGPLLPVLGHKPSLTQCLTNLLGNAVKFVSPGTQPRIRIWTEAIEPGDGHPQGRAVRLWVADNGIGIEPAAHQKIFEIFQRCHSGYEGTGIGLAIVKKAVERMQGRVGVLSAPGEGSRFWLELQAPA
jgi:PAS domain S-box-containing protein